MRDEAANPDRRRSFSLGSRSLASLLVLALIYLGARLSHRSSVSEAPQSGARVTLEGPIFEGGQLVAALELGYDQAALSFVKATDAPFRAPRLRENEAIFQARLQRTGEAPRIIEFNVPGLIDPTLNDLSDERGELRLGDEIFARTIGTLVKLPAITPPFALSILNPDGQELLRCRVDSQ